MPTTAKQTASRRRFIQYLAASPLFAGTSIAALAQETERVLQILRTELKVAMQEIGAPSLKDLKASMVLHV